MEGRIGVGVGTTLELLVATEIKAAVGSSTEMTCGKDADVVKESAEVEEEVVVVVEVASDIVFDLLLLLRCLFFFFDNLALL